MIALPNANEGGIIRRRTSGTKATSEAASQAPPSAQEFCDRGANVQALPGKKAFLTSVTGTGNLGSWADANGQSGIAAGDEICRSRAAEAGLQNAQNFKAWLSDDNTDASSRFTSDGPWVRLDGVVLAENHADLVDGDLNTSISLTETGTYVGFDYVWTGTNHIGGTTPDTCNNWADAAQSFNGSTGRTFDRSGWTYSGYPPCDWSLHLYCFED